MVPHDDEVIAGNPRGSPLQLRIGVAAVSAGVMTRNLHAASDCNRCVCGRCDGTGFDRDRKNRASRRCPRCKGQGSTQVGNTKR